MSKTLLRMMVDVPKTDRPATPAVVGCPVPVGLAEKLGELRLQGPAGSCPLTVRQLDVVAMNDAQWSQLAFVAQGPGQYTLMHEPGGDDLTAKLTNPAWVKDAADQLELGNGRLAITLPKKAQGPISQITLDGRPVISSADDLQFQTNGASSLHGTVSDIEVLEDSALRVKVRVSGDHRNKKGEACLTYRLEIELWADQPAARLDYQFFHVQPGIEIINIESIKAVFSPQLSKNQSQSKTKAAGHFLQVHHDLGMKPRLVENAKRAEIAADWSRKVPYLTDPAMLCDDIDYPYYLVTSTQQTSSWLGVTGEQGGMYLQLQDMINLRPKRLAAEDGVITADLWPREAGALELRQGKTRSHTFTLAFFDGEHKPQKPGDITSVLNLPLYEGRATLNKEDVRKTGVFDLGLTLPHNQTIRMEQYLLDLTTGVKLNQGLMNYGDGVEIGYSGGYSQIARNPLRPGRTNDIHPMRPEHPDAIVPGDLLRYEPVWANNEYDIIHALSIELLRTGRRSIWSELKATARHNIEVDFIHYSDDQWLHHGSPAHSANHAHASSYPSHLWTQGLLEYYCLSGDRDALDVAIKLGDTIIRNLEHPVRKHDFWGFNREIGWALLALVQLAEVTGIERFHEHAGKVVDYLVNYNREAQEHAIKLSNVDAMDDIHCQMVGAFFGYASMIEAMDRYARMTNRKDIADWLAKILDQVLTAAKRMFRDNRHIDSMRRMLPLGMAIGYERTGNVAFLEIGMLSLEMFFHTDVGITPSGEVKFAAMAHRSMVRFLGHAQKAGLAQKLEYTFASAVKG